MTVKQSAENAIFNYPKDTQNNPSMQGTADLFKNVRHTRDTKSLLLADSTLSYSAGAADFIAVGDRVRAGEFLYEAVASGATEYDLITAGSAKFVRLNKQVFSVSQTSVAGLSRLVNDMLLSPNTGGTFDNVEIIGMGSSVGVGGGLVDPANEAPVQSFARSFRSYFDPLGLGNVTVDNQSVNGSTVIDGDTLWPAVKAATTGKICVHIWGMNDAAVAIFNAGQTFKGFYRFLTRICIQQTRDGVTPVLVTSVHNHTGRTDYEMPPAVPQGWPTAEPAPVAPEDIWPPASESVQVITRDGLPSNADARMLMINNAIRAVAARVPGCVLIDAEPYWLEASGLHGEDALYDVGVFNHPNLFGHQQSYQRAFDDALRVAASGVGNATFEGPQHMQVVAGVDALSVSSNDPFLPDAPLAALATSEFTNAFEVYGTDARIDERYVPSTDFSNNISFTKLIAYHGTNRLGNPRFAETTYRRHQGVASAAFVSFTLPYTTCVGRMFLRSWSSTTNNYKSSSVNFAVKSGVLSFTEHGKHLTNGGDEVAAVSASGQDFRFTATQNGTEVSFEIEYYKVP